MVEQARKPEQRPCCAPWRLRGTFWDSGELTGPDAVRGGECMFCKREIAIRRPDWGTPCACIYCGLDLGWLPAIEHGEWFEGQAANAVRPGQVH